MGLRAARRKTNESKRPAHEHASSREERGNPQPRMNREPTVTPESPGETTMQQVVHPINWADALGAVQRNAGAPGPDGMDTVQLEHHLHKHGETIRKRLLEGRHKPGPVRKVQIPKPDGGKRALGIPNVPDRFIQQLLLLTLAPEFEPRFSKHSHGFIKGRSPHTAIAEAQQHAQAGKDWLVDMEVNAKKSGTCRPWTRKFPGIILTTALLTTIAPQSLGKSEHKVREHWDARQPLTSNQLRDNWRKYVQGWWGYYRHCEKQTPIKRKEGWIRRHMRKCYWQRWHNTKGRKNKIRKLGGSEELIRMGASSKGAWRVAKSSVRHKTLSNRVLGRTGHVVPTDLT
jgi:hypothetical protein